SNEQNMHNLLALGNFLDRSPRWAAICWSSPTPLVCLVLPDAILASRSTTLARSRSSLTRRLLVGPLTDVSASTESISASTKPQLLQRTSENSPLLRSTM